MKTIRSEDEETLRIAAFAVIMVCIALVVTITLMVWAAFGVPPSFHGRP